MISLIRVLSVLKLALAMLLVLSFANLPGNDVFAQSAEQISEDFQPLIDSAKESGLSVIVISPTQEQAKGSKDGPGIGERVLKIRSELRRIIGSSPDAFSNIEKTLKRVSPDGTYQWLWVAIITAIAGIAVGTGPAFLLRKWTRSYFKEVFNPDPKTRAQKTSYLMLRAFIILINVTVLAALSVLVAVIFDSGHDASRATVGVIIGAYAVYRIFRHVIFFNLIAPDLPSHRMINLGDESADRMQRDWRAVALIVIVTSAFFVWMALIGLGADTLKLLVMTSLLSSAVLVGFLMLKHRQDFYGIILGEGEPSSKPVWRRFLASQWHLIIIGYLVVAWIVSSVRVILNLPSSLAVIGAPVTALIVGIAVYSLLLIFIDRSYAVRRKRFEERVARAHELNVKRQEAEQAALEEALVDPPEDDEELIVNQVMSEKQIERMPIFKPVFQPLLEQAVGILVSILGIGFILGAWDVNIGERGNPVTAFIDTLAIAFVAWFLYRAVVVYIDNQLEAEGDDAQAEDGEPGEEMSGQGSSRLATMLPLIKNVLIAAIVILSAMVILSNMGVDIAPLFAGAGVIGLAVGFGAQTLIRDIFSGGFFLFDDAFRRGEYIELGDIRGTVEKISLRSFQLRHHNGPLHTVPFGEIKQLTNYSRDWVMMKLPLRLTYDTDVERVRKLLKKLGQQLLEHPEVGELFMQPLKSQGVYKMEDSAMIMRVKFMTKPGDQFVTRKVVYAEIRELFEREGIRFANKEVTVRLADESTKSLTADQTKAVAAAARASIDADAAPATGGDDR